MKAYDGTVMVVVRKRLTVQGIEGKSKEDVLDALNNSGYYDILDEETIDFMKVESVSLTESELEIDDE